VRIDPRQSCRSASDSARARAKSEVHTLSRSQKSRIALVTANFVRWSTRLTPPGTVIAARGWSSRSQWLSHSGLGRRSRDAAAARNTNCAPSSLRGWFLSSMAGMSLCSRPVGRPVTPRRGAMPCAPNRWRRFPPPMIATVFPDGHSLAFRHRFPGRAARDRRPFNSVPGLIDPGFSPVPME